MRGRCRPRPMTPSTQRFPFSQSILRRLPRLAAQLLIGGYRLTFSPLVGLHCRHLPTCSIYAGEAIGRFGLWAGGWMALARLCRCQPFGTSGLDFVPELCRPVRGGICPGVTAAGAEPITVLIMNHWRTRQSPRPDLGASSGETGRAPRRTDSRGCHNISRHISRLSFRMSGDAYLHS